MRFFNGVVAGLGCGRVTHELTPVDPPVQRTDDLATPETRATCRARRRFRAQPVRARYAARIAYRGGGGTTRPSHKLFSVGPASNVRIIESHARARDYEDTMLDDVTAAALIRKRRSKQESR